ncbi:hypothetical protein BG004_007956 [Podila humilis]|nr:hypothetical protein BG004_007956 [Podila humilis]
MGSSSSKRVKSSEEIAKHTHSKPDVIATKLQFTNDSIVLKDVAAKIAEALKSDVISSEDTHTWIWKAAAKAIDTSILPAITSTKVSTLDLSKMSLGDSEVTKLSKALNANPLFQVSVLDLSRNNFGVLGAQALAKFLKSNITVTHINLLWNKLEDDSAQALAIALETNTTLESLNLVSNSIGEAGARAFARALRVNTTLNILALSSNKISFHGALMLLSVVSLSRPTSIVVALKHNAYDGKVHQDLATAFSNHAPSSQRVYVDLKFIPISDDGAVIISQELQFSKHVERLNLGACDIGFVGAQAIAQALTSCNTTTTLKTLQMTGNSIGRNGAHALAKALETNSTISTLTMIGNDIEDGGAYAFAELLKTNNNTTLKDLDLNWNSIGDNGIVALSTALRTNSSLTRLSLENNMFGEKGILALSEALMVNTSLAVLELQYNKLGDNGAQSLAVAIKANTGLRTLDLSRNGIGGGGGGRGAQALCEALRINTTLRTLNLRYNDLKCVDLLALSMASLKQPTSTKLELSDNGFNASVLQSLSKAFPEIGVATTTTSATTTRTVPRTNIVDLSYQVVGDQGAISLAEGLAWVYQHLTALDLRSCKIRDKGAQALATAIVTNRTLTTLDLTYNPIGFPGYLSLLLAQRQQRQQQQSDNPTLQDLKLARISVPARTASELLDVFSIDSTRTSLHLDSQDITKEDAVVLAKSIVDNKGLTTLNLDHNAMFGWEGVLSLSEVLSNHRSVITLTTLSLCGNGIGDKGAGLLAEALKADHPQNNHFLTTLELWSNSIGYEGAMALSDALTTNSTLKSLELRCNHIGDRGAQAFATALIANDGLLHLDVRNNAIGDAGVVAVSEALGINATTLRSLYLDSNDVGDVGAFALTKMLLEKNLALVTLTVEHNRIGHGGVEALKDMASIVYLLKINTTLTALNLNANSIGDSGAQAIAKALEANTTLVTLNLGFNHIGQDGGLVLAQALETNRSLSRLVLSRNFIGDKALEA